MTSKQIQQENEQHIFSEFKAVAPFKITGFESRNEPEPDILATLDSGELAAFELTQVDDQKVLEKESNDFDLNQQLQELRSQLTNLDDLQGRYIHIHFINQSFPKQKQLLPKVIELINQNGPVKQYIRDVQGNVVGIVGAFNLKSTSPLHLAIGTGSNVGDYVVERINKKIHDKVYSTPHTIHLLAWGRKVWPEDQWHDELKAIAAEQKKFEKIWVFSRAGEKLFQFPHS